MADGGGKSSGANRGGRRGPSAGTAVHERIKADILSFAFLPSERLVEAELCDRYEVSRTPVREALRRLQDDGLVVQREKGGRFVRSLDVTTYLDVYRVRRALELLGIELVCERLADVDLDEIVGGWRQGFSSRTVPLDGSYIVADERFHLAIAEASGNEYLVQSIVRINDQIRVIRSFDFSVRKRVVDSEADHVAIGEQIAKGKVKKAQELMTRHIVHSTEELRGITLRILDKAYGARS
jgi:DNA-binding GntR family transcriptional regulator